MRINKIYLEAALNELAERHINNKQLEKSRRNEILEKLPEYQDLENQLMQTVTDMISAVMDKSLPANEVSANALNKNKEIQRQMDELLERNGYPADYLDPIYTCPICKDKGNTGSDWCECLYSLTNKMAAEELNENAPLDKSRFNNFDIERYSDKTDKDNTVSSRNIMQKNFEYCELFAEQFNGKGSSILMVGNTGLGKTHLSLAIANKLIENGFCVVYGSVTELIRKINSEQFDNVEGDTMSLVKSCDLLILDDLGVENKSEWNASLLYEIINTRQNKRAPMIINTNLDLDELTQCYGDRLSSRMFSMKVMFFEGTDNRVAFSENYNI